MMSSPASIPGASDGGAHIKFLTLDVYPTDMLAWLVRDTGMLPADIVVYDLEHLKLLPIEIASDLPAGEWRRVQKTQGYRWIMVNGEVTSEDGRCTGATPGGPLRHGRQAWEHSPKKPFRELRRGMLQRAPLLFFFFP